MMMKYWKVSMKVQLTQNLTSIKKISPKHPIKSRLIIRPTPLEGNRFKFTFWKFKPNIQTPNKTTISKATNPVKIWGGSIL